MKSAERPLTPVRPNTIEDVEIVTAPAINLTAASRSPLNKAATAAGKSHSKDYLFVNNVRFLSMVAVVAMHCLQGVLHEVAHRQQTDTFALALQQPFKFGTIGFFLISGFLMSGSLTQHQPLQYLRKRMRTVFKPWSVWYIVFIGFLVTSDLVHTRILIDSWAGLTRFLQNKLFEGLFFSSFWFVPNLLIALAVLLLCGRRLYDIRTGCFFLAISLAYGLNLHTSWLPIASHTEALFGFIFYLWLGAFAAHRFHAFSQWLSRIPLWALLAAAGLACLAASVEGAVLAGQGNPAALNTLRISNQIFSVLAVVAVFRLPGSLAPHWFNPRATTFGVYLLHTIVLWTSLSVLKRLPRLFPSLGEWIYQPFSLVLLSLALLGVVYTACVWLSLRLLHSSLSWTVGGSAVSVSAYSTPRIFVQKAGLRLKQACSYLNLTTWRG